MRLRESPVRHTLDTEEAKQWIHGLRYWDLVDLSRGHDSLNLVVDRSSVVAEEAARQRELRYSGESRLRGTLLSLGFDFSPADPAWRANLLTCVKGSEIGLVDNARGVAVLTGVSLAPEQIEAMRIDIKSDPGEYPASSEELPAGWIQLRGEMRPYGPSPFEQIEGHARLVCYGLRTCYGHRGAPATHVLHSRSKEIHPAEWEFRFDQRQVVQGMVDRWLKEWCQTLARELSDPQPVLDSIESDDIPRYIAKLTDVAVHGEADFSWRRSEAAQDSSVALLTKWGVSVACQAADADGGIVGYRWIDKLYAIFQRVIYDKLKPVSLATGWMADTPGCLADPFAALLVDAGKQIGIVIGRDIYRSVEKLRNDLMDVLYDRGPIYSEHTI